VTAQRNRVLVLVLAGALAGLLLILLVPHVYAELVANIERVQALRGLDLPEHQRSLDEAAWDSGWRSLCPPGGAATPVPPPTSDRVLDFNALASIDRGDYATALAMLRHLVDSGLTGIEPNARAYQAALEMDWVAAAQRYQPLDTPRHERWWGTVFYLAAQQRMFDGALDEADELYRRADAAYGVHGPYLGLGLVECLVQQGRVAEAWDAYRRVLVVMPPEEALAHLSRFNELRLEALRAWHEQQPENAQVAHWLAFYEGERQREAVASEALDAEPVPMVPIELDLGEGRTLLGFDYRVEDLETGSYMAADFYMREGPNEQASYRRVRQVVLNQAPNGAFAWDAVPDGVRPVGWHVPLYDRDLGAVQYHDLSGKAHWLCMNGGAIEAAFGLQSELAAVSAETPVYLQGGDAYVSDEGSLAHGRRWFGTDDTPYPYSYLPGGHLQNEVESMTGVWTPDEGVEAVAVWLFSTDVGRACARNVYLFPLPDLEPAE
jgi:tetratricopeptide (TPR) repeat protein